MMGHTLQIPSAITFEVPIGTFIYSYGWDGEPHYIGSSRDVTRIGTTLADAIAAGRSVRMTILEHSPGMLIFPQPLKIPKKELTHTENLLVALNSWINGGLRENGVQNDGDRKAAWIGGEDLTTHSPLEHLIHYYTELTDSYEHSWKAFRDKQLQALSGKASTYKTANKHLCSKHPNRAQWPAMIFEKDDCSLRFVYCSKNGDNLHPTGNATTPRPTECWRMDAVGSVPKP